MAKERPILMSGENVRGILAGRKTQTRRTCRDQTATKYEWLESCEMYPSTLGEHYTGWAKDCGFSFLLPTKCSYGVVGDLLYVRETWRMPHSMDNLKPMLCGDFTPVEYLADGYIRFPENSTDKIFGKVRPSIFMPKNVCRIWLEITGIRVERVQDISISDCVDEGIQRLRGPLPPCPTTSFKDYSGETIECGATASFRTLWDSLNAKRGYGWNKDPWVWVIEFKKIERKKR